MSDPCDGLGAHMPGPPHDDNRQRSPGGGRQSASLRGTDVGNDAGRGSQDACRRD